ncbi:MAG: hypothetical protein QM399_00480 [Bacillota bacterium]|jgi:CheY-specific phosphatase CheX|nr:hypothetical protein [Bacillota bacterium]
MMWKEKYRIGVEAIDNQHRELFQRVSDFLMSADYMCNICPPQIVLGGEASLAMVTPKALIVPFKTRIGEFDIFITLKEQT